MARREAEPGPKRLKSGLNPHTRIPLSQRYFKLAEERERLPAREARGELLALLDKFNVVIVQGETGSGKTTQIPQFLLDSPHCRAGTRIAITQPRRIAAISVARRVAEETDTILGDLVGYSVRFDDCTSSSTRLKFLTEGMLLREMIADRALAGYSVVVLDEVHERSTNTDVLLALLKELAAAGGGRRGALKLVVMSATIEVERLSSYFEAAAPVLTVPGRQFPVEVYYAPRPEADYLAASVRTAAQIHLFEPPGDVLVFLTGEDEVEDAAAQIAAELASVGEEARPAVVLPLYGALSGEAQQRVFEGCGDARKIVVATNIAETSVTLEGVVYVVDCGLAKQKVYNPRLKFESLLVAPISRASAKQRAGRAGRTQPGKCFRLYTEASFEKDLREFGIPEMLRSELSALLLQLKLLNVDNIVKFDFMDPPAPETVFRALEALVHLGAISPASGRITPEGRTLGQFPLDPRQGKALLRAKELGCAEEALNVISVLCVGNWKLRPLERQREADACHRRFAEEPACDLWATHLAHAAFTGQAKKREFCAVNFLNYRALSAAENVRSQLKHLLLEAKTAMDDNTAFGGLPAAKRLRVCFLAGFFQQVAHLQRSGQYSVLREGLNALIHPSTLVRGKPEFVLYLEFILTSKQYIRTVSEIRAEWLLALFPELFEPAKIANADARRALEAAAKAVKK